MSLDRIEKDWHNPNVTLLELYGGQVGVRDYFWKQMVSPHARYFFEQLQEDVDSSNEEVVAAWLQQPTNKQEAIMRYGDGPNSPFRPLRDVFRAHLVCALLVIRHKRNHKHWVSNGSFIEQLKHSIHQYRIDLPLGLAIDLADDLASRERRKPEGVIVAPFALVSKGKDSGPVLAQFRLERLLHGRGDLYVTPEQMFLRMDNAFYESVFDAAKRAVDRLLENLEDKEKPYHNCDVRIRIEQFDLRNTLASVQLFDPEGSGGSGELFEEELTGRSASGAAAWALFFCRTTKKPDPGLIVLAQVDSALGVSGINEVETKVRKIAEYNCFDTIAVADADNAKQAKDTLEELSKAGDTTVVNMEEIDVGKT